MRYGNSNRLASSEQGVTMLEVALICALIMVVCIPSVSFFGERTEDTFDDVASQISFASLSEDPSATTPAGGGMSLPVILIGPRPGGLPSLPLWFQQNWGQGTSLGGGEGEDVGLPPPG